MDKAGYLKHKEVIEAWANGAEIQYSDPYGMWFTCVEAPSWDGNIKYRIKPKKPVKRIEKRHILLKQEWGGTLEFRYDKDPNIAFTFNAETGELLDVEKL